MPYLKTPENIVPARFLERLNRFVARVAVDGAEALVHVPSSGRMRELLTPGAAVYLQPYTGPGRRTAYKLLLVDYGGTLVSVDSLLPNRLLHHAFLHRAMPGFEAYSETCREVAFRAGRIDFLLTGKDGRCRCLFSSERKTPPPAFSPPKNVTKNAGSGNAPGVAG